MRHHTDGPRDTTRKEDTDNVASSIRNMFQSMHIMPKHIETDQGKIAEEKEIDSRKLNGMCFYIPGSKISDVKDIEIITIILVRLIMTLSRGHTGQIKRIVIMR